MTARIISASRRTDIPAFYSEWFMNRVRAGFCHWLNPYGGQVYRVSLAPEDVIAFAFWTRNPAPLLPHLPELHDRGYHATMHYSLLGYGRPLESHNPGIEQALHTFAQASERLGPPFVHWRYDPIVLSSLTPARYHLDRFAFLAERLRGLTRRCTYSLTSTAKRGATCRTSASGTESHSTCRMRTNAMPCWGTWRASPRRTIWDWCRAVRTMPGRSLEWNAGAASIRT